MRYRVLPYKQGSKSAKALAEALGGKVLKLVESTFRPKHEDIIINWGRTEQYITPSCLINCSGGCGNCDPTVLNPSGRVISASNKLRFFELTKDLNICPRFWTNKDEIPDEAFPIVCRTVLAGHSGDGIVIANDRSELVPAPLYVEYKKKKDEYRIHVGCRITPYVGELNPGGLETTIIASQRKAKRHDAENVNWQVRNLSNGFVYVREGVNPPSDVIEKAKQALEASGLDFGAVDVIYNASEEKAYVLEINTAPGLEGQTVEDYANFFRNV